MILPGAILPESVDITVYEEGEMIANTRLEFLMENETMSEETVAWLKPLAEGDRDAIIDLYEDNYHDVDEE